MRTLLLVASLCALGAVGCGSGTDEAAPPAAAETTLPSKVSSRPHAPAIAGLTIDGDTISLASFFGRPVMVNVWSSWWSTCQSEAVAYAEFQQDHPELTYLGVNVADTPSEAQAFIDGYGWTWPSIRDPRREQARTLGAEYQPHFVLIDSQGRIVDTWEGGGDDRISKAMVAKLP